MNASCASPLNRILPNLAIWIVFINPLSGELFRGKELGPIGVADRSGLRIRRVEPNRSVGLSAFYLVFPGNAFGIVFLDPSVRGTSRCEHLHPFGIAYAARNAV